MRQKKFQLNWYQTNDTAAMEHKLEKMAAKGWFLKKANNWGWVYRRGEPAHVKYTITYFPAASIFDAGPTEDQQTYADYCRAAGWEFVTALGPVQFFRSTRRDAVPIETDEAYKLRSIHKAMLKTWVLSYILLLVSNLLNLSTRISTFKRDPLATLSSNGSLALLFMLAFFLVFLLGSLADYFLWYYRSRRSVEDGGVCLQPHTRARLWASFLLLAACALAITAWIADISSPGMAWLWVYSFAGIALILALSQGLMALMKRKGFSRGANRTVFLISVVVLSFAYTGSMIPLVLRLADANLMEDGTSAYTYTDASGWAWEIYKDDLPLTLEDLGYTVTDADHCSYRAERSGSFLLARTVYTQDAFHNSDLPRLEYYEVEIRWDWLRSRVLERWAKEWTLQEADDPRWGAEQVFFHAYSVGYTTANGNLASDYLLVYGERIICFDAVRDFPIDQLAAAAAKTLAP